MAKPDTLVEYKSQLAKLMATENISVRHRPIKTAKFDMKNRILHCPIWNDMTGDIYDLLMGHEISHALHTPLEGWHDTIAYDKARPNIKSFLNVCEDARIEKIIKRKYPGLRASFANAYKTLTDRDFFQVKNLDINKLRLIDRLNLHFKVGAFTTVEFTDQEQTFVDRAAELETFEEVIQLARDIYDYQKFQEPKKQPKKEPPKDMPKPEPEEDGDGGGNADDEVSEPSPQPTEEDSDDGGGSSEAIDGEEDSDDTEDSDESGDIGDQDEDVDSGQDDNGEEGSSEGDSEDGDNEEEDESDEGTTSGDGAGSEPEEPTSLTDEAFRKEEEKLINHFGSGQLFQTMPEPMLENIIIPHDKVYKKFKASFEYEMRKVPVKNAGEIIAGLNVAFQNRNRAFISTLVKEFEMRKNASQYARQLTAKTGQLDEKKLARYKLTSDMFRKVTTVNKGKSHGMVMFLDFSSSMVGTIREIIEQLLIFVSFCRKAGIPFDVYAYGDAHSYIDLGLKFHDKFTQINNGFFFSSNTFCLRHLISSKLKANDYRNAFNMLNLTAQYCIVRDRHPDVATVIGSDSISLYSFGFQLGGTPFCEALVASKTIIQNFKRDNALDIVNVVYLTDGDGNQSVTLGLEYEQIDPIERSNTTIGFEDHKTRTRVLSQPGPAPFQAAITKLVKEVTGCTHIGYYFCGADEIENRIDADPILKADRIQHRDHLKKHGFVSVQSLGYDNYYYIDLAQIGYYGNLVVHPGQDMTHAAIQHQMRKMNSKLIIKKFAIDVAE